MKTMLVALDAGTTFVEIEDQWIKFVEHSTINGAFGGPVTTLLNWFAVKCAAPKDGVTR